MVITLQDFFSYDQVDNLTKYCGTLDILSLTINLNTCIIKKLISIMPKMQNSHFCFEWLLGICHQVTLLSKIIINKNKIKIIKIKT